MIDLDHDYIQVDHGTLPRVYRDRSDWSATMETIARDYIYSFDIDSMWHELYITRDLITMGSCGRVFDYTPDGELWEVMEKHIHTH